MAWDPANLQLESVVPNKVTDKDSNVTITIRGSGFDIGDNMFGVFVMSGHAPAREATIPCNDIQVTDGDFEATASICPRDKLPGSYDLLFWLKPPDDVEVPGKDDAPATKVRVPVNDVAVLPAAITIVELPA